MGRPHRSSTWVACITILFLLISIAGAVGAEDAAQAQRDEVPLELLEAEPDAAVPEGYRLCPDAFVPCACGAYGPSYGAHRRHEEEGAQLSHEHRQRYVNPPSHKHHCCCPQGPSCSTGGVTEVLNFDDLPQDPVPTNYRNFTWSASAYAYTASPPTGCIDGYFNGIVSPPNAMYTIDQDPVSMSAPPATLFTVTSLEATTSSQSNVLANFTGFDGQGNQVGQVQAPVNITGPVTVDLSSLGCISTLTMEAACGDDVQDACFAGECKLGRTSLVIDNIVVTRFNAPGARNTWRPATLRTANAHGRDAANSMLPPGTSSRSKPDTPRKELPTKP